MAEEFSPQREAPRFSRSDGAGTNDQVFLMKFQSNVAWTAPFKETPVGGCGRGQERSGDIKPKCSVPPNDKLVHYSTNA